ncbi:MAG: hypothetical protein GY875_03610 [Gammaproteobacteria bacterium]|nr:hypothetical protein [Gammaproteobacteria bacterium]
MKTLLAASCLFLFTSLATAAELSGVFIDDEYTTGDGQQLVLNGVGLREKLWVDVYVGSLYLAAKSNDVAEILSKPGPWRIQLDFIYKEVAQQKLVDSWREGFEKNQSAESLQALQSRIDQFNAYFDASAVAKDRYAFDYNPATGTRVSKNQQVLGVIAGEDFKNALLEIWLGNHPADKNLKKGMLGL